MRTVLQGFKYLLLLIAGLILIVLIILFSRPLWHRFITYPRLENQVKEFSKLRKEPQSVTKLSVFRGVMHLHSYWSHDCEGTLYDLVTASKDNGIDFVFLTDHPRGNIDTLPRDFKGVFDGVLIEPGSEKQGFDTWPLDSVIIDWNKDKDTIAKNIVQSGGIIFYAHTEEPHNWGNPWYQGMEIYNFHTDTKDESLVPQIANFIVNGKKYRHWAYREMFDEQKPILSLWDSLNTWRKIVGFSAVDAHENQNFRARYLKDGMIEWLGPDAKVIDTTKVKFWHKWIIHEPDSSGWIFKWMIDTYETSFSYITNYVFSESSTLSDLVSNIKQGHLFTAFKSLGDAKGFVYYSTGKDKGELCIMGDSVGVGKVKSLNAVSPLPGEFRLIHDGKTINVSGGEDYRYSWTGSVEKGAWRIEVWIKLNGKSVPWIYSNPIYVY